MRHRLVTMSIAVVGVLIASAPLMAHHSSAAFDVEKRMTLQGWARTSLKPGDHMTISVQPARSGKPVGRVVQVVLPSGKTLIAYVGTRSAAAR